MSPRSCTSYLLKERGELGNYVVVRLVVRVEEGGHSLQGVRDLGSGGARHRGRVGVGDVLGRLVSGVVLERRGLLRLRHRSGKRRRVADFDLGRRRSGGSTPPPVLAADQEATSSSCTRDAYGKCVPAGCASYFDGCNTCNVGAVLGCTMMYCDKPQEPKCLAYIGETEKN